MLRTLLLASAALALTLTSSAQARLQVSITDGTTIFSCFDGEAGCDFAGAASNLLTLDNTIGNFLVTGTASISTSGKEDTLSISNFGIREINSSLGGHLSFFVSDTGFASPVGEIGESGSGTFLNNVDAGDALVKFWADKANVQGADPLNTPGQLLDTLTGAITKINDSFSGSASELDALAGPFSMTMEATTSFIPGGSVTGFNANMAASAVPESSSWIMLVLGFGLLGWAGRHRVGKTSNGMPASYFTSAFR